MLTKSFDVIIVGAGPSGALLGALLAREGISVAIIEKLDKMHVGEKPCGEGLIQHCLPEINPDPLPQVDVTWTAPNVRIHLAYENNIATLKYRIYMINRHQIIKQLLELAEKHGAEIYYGTHATKPILKGNNVAGVKARRNKEVLHFQGKLIVDASGYVGVLRNCLKDMFVEHSYSDREVAIGYRLYAQLSQNVEDSHIIFDPQNLRGGYFWVFPRGTNNNIGVGAIKTYANPKIFPELIVRYLSQLNLEIKEITIDGAYGLIPARRPFASLVADGIILVGDAGSITNPIHGGGICTGFRSAKIAFETLIDKLEKNGQKLSINDLWDYSYKLNTTEGKKHAIFEIGRIFLEGLSKKELKNLAGLSHKLSGDLKEKIISEEENKFSLFFSPRLAMRLYKLKKLIRRIEENYRIYPKTPHNIISWANKIKKIIDFARKQFIRH